MSICNEDHAVHIHVLYRLKWKIVIILIVEVFIFLKLYFFSSTAGRLMRSALICFQMDLLFFIVP